MPTELAFMITSQVAKMEVSESGTASQPISTASFSARSTVRFMITGTPPLCLTPNASALAAPPAPTTATRRPLSGDTGSDSDSDLAGAGGRSGAAPPPPPTNHRVATVCPPSLRELTVGRWGDAAPTAVHVVSGPSGTPGPGIALSPPPWGHFGRASPVEWTIWASSLSLIQLRGFGSMDLDAKAKALALPEAAQGPGGDGHVMVT
mmetsp:Transcript_4213/g.7380  ORF Transcript_4213/g.7380 Transcript_4213/m.7380 type:complete len:206 (+) Transcript_4213:901-1518(+)